MMSPPEYGIGETCTNRRSSCTSAAPAARTRTGRSSSTTSSPTTNGTRKRSAPEQNNFIILGEPTSTTGRRWCACADLWPGCAASRCTIRWPSGTKSRFRRPCSRRPGGSAWLGNRLPGRRERTHTDAPVMARIEVKIDCLQVGDLPRGREHPLVRLPPHPGRPRQTPGSQR